MALFRRRVRESSHEAATAVAEEDAASRDWSDHVEIDVVGGSRSQSALELIAGPRDEDDKSCAVAITLRYEPTNLYDLDSIRVEAFGMLLGHDAPATAADLSPAMAGRGGGLLECVGVVVGGWSRDGGRDEGRYDVRVFLSRGDAERLGVDCDLMERQ
jgi:hypothetical protein